MEEVVDLLPIIIPLASLQLLLLIFSVRDWMKQPRDMDMRPAWLFVIFFGGTLGPILYLLFAPRVGSEEMWLED